LRHRRGRNLAAKLQHWADARDELSECLSHTHCSACDRDVILDEGLRHDAFGNDTCRQNGQLMPHAVSADAPPEAAQRPIMR
jgi:hypothetical protein